MSVERGRRSHRRRVLRFERAVLSHPCGSLRVQSLLEREERGRLASKFLGEGLRRGLFRCRRFLKLCHGCSELFSAAAGPLGLRLELSFFRLRRGLQLLVQGRKLVELGGEIQCLPLKLLHFGHPAVELGMGVLQLRLVRVLLRLLVLDRQGLRLQLDLELAVLPHHFVKVLT